MQNLPDKSVDAIITDPPYNISRKNNFKTMGRSGIDFGEWDKDFDQISWLRVAVDKLKDGGSIIVFNSWKNMGDIVRELEALGCVYKDMIQWWKANPMPRNRERRYVTRCEFALWLTKGKGWTFNRQKPTYEDGIFTYPIVTNKERIHPTQKSVGLISDIIKIHTNKGDLILDPFMGSGTTAVACIDTERNYIGFELDENYCKAANKRIDSYRQTNSVVNL